MDETIQEKNKALVLEAFDTLFNKRDYAAAEKYWSPDYIQHSAHIEPGRDGLFNLIRNAPDTLRYEHQLIVAEGDYVIIHGRFSGNGPPCCLDCRGHCTGSRTAASPSIGMFCRMKRLKPNQRVVCPCLAKSFQKKEKLGDKEHRSWKSSRWRADAASRWCSRRPRFLGTRRLLNESHSSHCLR